VKTAVCLLLVCLGNRAFARDKVIYGEDDRVDYYTASPEWRALADSTAALFKADKVAPDGTLSLETLASRHNLCSGQRFGEQPAGSYCSGSLVAPDVIMTAGHCLSVGDSSTNGLDVPECADIKFVFGYALKSPGAPPGKADPADVYRCAGVIARGFPGIGSRTSDYALLRLDRPVRNRAPVPLNRGKGVSAGNGVGVIGYPSGLPLKIAAGAAVRDASSPVFFTANLDSFGGNSGSMVFNLKTGLVEGIVVRGDSDFASNGDCNVYNIKPQNGGRGEDVIKISVILPHLNPPAEAATAEPAAAYEDIAARSRAILLSFDGVSNSARR